MCTGYVFCSSLGLNEIKFCVCIEEYGLLLNQGFLSGNAVEILIIDRFLFEEFITCLSSGKCFISITMKKRFEFSWVCCK
jgi:hypothetical protein